MPRGVHVTPSMSRRMYDMFCERESVEDIADTFKVSVYTVRKHIREERKASEAMSRNEKIVGKDASGKCVSFGNDDYLGTHTTPDGKPHRKRFKSVNYRVAESTWRRWCETLDDEYEFLRNIARAGSVDEPSVEDDEVEDVPAVEQDETDPVADADDESDADEPDAGMQDEVDALRARVQELEAALREKDDHPSQGVACVVWMVSGDTIRHYGVYASEDRAIDDVLRLNEVAEFIGGNSKFKVDEVAWR